MKSETRMFSVRLKNQTIDKINKISNKMSKTTTTSTKFSHAMILEIAIELMEKQEISTLIEIYKKTFK